MQENLEKTLSQLVSIPSVSSNSAACHEILKLVRGKFDGLNLYIHENCDTPNPWFLATTQNTMTPDILLLAHLDVVPASPEMFTIQKTDGRLYGRGSYDMKFAAACYLEFIKNHADKLSNLNIGFLITTDEEIGGACIADVFALGLRPKVAFIPDGGGDWKIEERAKGLLGIEFIANGKSAHGSRPWEGENALHRLMDALQMLRNAYPLTSSDDSTLTINTLNAGNAINQIADYAVATADFRTFSLDELNLCRSLAAQIAEEYSLEFTISHEGYPLLLDKNSPYVTPFLDAYRKQRGGEPEYVESYGATDGRHFAEYDIPCIITEPYGHGRHADEEWLLAEDLGNYYKLIERWLLPQQSL
ncbi:MAG: M20/M25/M40 family metallo-hydrolase [Candidatus Saccharibacteria bacterium]|nr:MAG: M20/M25/M40 family metallo-hydrolase [Candidatus Saccharibacteria bacterium]